MNRERHIQGLNWQPALNVDRTLRSRSNLAASLSLTTRKGTRREINDHIND